MENKDRDREQGAGFGTSKPGDFSSETTPSESFRTESPMGEEQKPATRSFETGEMSEFQSQSEQTGWSSSGTEWGSSGEGRQGERREAVKDYARKQAGMAKEKAKSKLSKTGEQFAGTLGDVGHALHDMGYKLDEENHRLVGQYVHTAAEQIDRAAESLRNHDLEQVFDRVETQIRRSPGLYIGGAIALGFFLGRFMKSSGRHAHEESHGYGEYSESSEGMERFENEGGAAIGASSTQSSYSEEENE